jgi:putative ABC transport system permease protein
MEKLIRDLKYGIRFLIRSKGFALAVILTLSACIGVNVAIFAIVNSVLLRPLPVPDSQDIVLMSNRYPKAGADEQFISSSGYYFDALAWIPTPACVANSRRLSLQDLAA